MDRKRTTMNLDRDLVQEAGVVLGTSRATDTVHAAMREIVDRAKREELVARDDFGDMTPEVLEEIRRERDYLFHLDDEAS